jgi:regulator of protease activity HflC (stomatin/prohibitin superfamily)
MGMAGLPLGLFFVIIFLLILAASAIKILREYERGVIFRLGRLIGAKGPGVIFIIPGVDKLLRISLRTVAL